MVVFSFIYMGRLFHLFPGIRVNPVVLPNFAVSLSLSMAAHGGVTYTLSDYWVLGPPFLWGLHLSFEQFFLGGGGIALGIPLFSLSCFFTVSKLIFPLPGNSGLKFLFSSCFLCSFIHKPKEHLKSVFSGPLL